MLIKTLGINKIIKCISLVFFTTLLSSCVAEKKLNIIFILTDDQGWGDLGVTGNPYLKTKNIDQLANKGALFTSFYVGPVCSPTRAEILTGRYHPKSGVYSTSQGGERIDLDEILFPQYFQENGYATGAFGKWHNEQQHPYHPNARGFDEFYGYCSGHLGSYFDADLEHNGTFVKSKGYLTDVLTNKALTFIEENQNNPFFVFLPLNTPHRPMQVPDRWWNKFKDIDLNESMSEVEKNHTRAAYAMIENIDWNVGKIIKKLEALNISENTLVVFLGDNGPNGNRWNDSLKGIKGSTDEGGVKSSLIMYLPGKIKNAEITQLSGSIDLAPTLIDLANIKSFGHNMDGISLSPFLKGNKSQYNRALFQHWFGNVSVRIPTFRLDKDNVLYNIDLDPKQLNPIENKRLKDSLIHLKQEWVDEVLSQTPNVDKRPIPISGNNKLISVLPARDARLYGDKIKRSNRWPNDSFLFEWKSNDSYAYWPVEVEKSGYYSVSVYCTTSNEALGTELLVYANDDFVSTEIVDVFDPSLRGFEHDRVIRNESYVKDFKKVDLPNIYLEKGPLEIKLKKQAREDAPGVDFKMLVLSSLINL